MPGVRGDAIVRVWDGVCTGPDDGAAAHPVSSTPAARFDGSSPRSRQNERDWTACDVAVRLAPGVSSETARAQAEQLVAGVPFASERRAGPTVTGGPGAPDVEKRHIRLVPALRGTDDLRVQTGQPLASFAPAVPVFDVETGVARRERGIARERHITGFASVYGLLALLMACVGVYGLMAYTVFRRQGEIGVRIALGAEPGVVSSAMVRESLVPVAAGLGAGLVIAIALTRWMDALLVGVSRTDPLTLVAAVVLLVTTAAAAAWLPARRAARIDPIRTLRME